MKKKHIIAIAVTLTLVAPRRRRNADALKQSF
jgi:hypothetical protein